MQTQIRVSNQDLQVFLTECSIKIWIIVRNATQEPLTNRNRLVQSIRVGYSILLKWVNVFKRRFVKIEITVAVCFHGSQSKGKSLISFFFYWTTTGTFSSKSKNDKQERKYKGLRALSGYFGPLMRQNNFSCYSPVILIGLLEQ